MRTSRHKLCHDSNPHVLDAVLNAGSYAHFCNKRSQHSHRGPLMTNPKEPLQLRLCGVAAESARASAICACVAQLVPVANLVLELLSL